MKKRRLLIVLAMMLTLSLLALQAAAESDVSTWAKLQAAIDATDGNDTSPAASATTITLTKSLTATDGEACLSVPAGKKIILDLNGFTLDRGLKSKTAAEDGSVISVEGELTLEDSSERKTGTVTGGNTTGNGGGVYVCGLRGTFTLNSGNISGNSAESGGGVHTGSGIKDSSCNFTMNGGTIGYNTAKYGGGVRIKNNQGNNDYAGFTMTGGTICNNTATSDGGGVSYYRTVKLLGRPSLTMTGGTVCNNTAKYAGGGLVIYNNADDGCCKISGVVISGNSGYQGGGLSLTGSAENLFEMKDASISGNTATQGGGVFVSCQQRYTGSGYVNGSAAMENVRIIENEADYGGGVYLYGGTLTIQGSEISGNTAVQSGGGICNGASAYSTVSLVAEDVQICGNEAKYGGGILGAYGSITISDAVFSSNKAKFGGALQISAGSTLKLHTKSEKSIIIRENTATGAEGGIANWGTLSLSGKIIIKDNTCDAVYGTDTPYPQNLATESAVTVSGALTGSEIYITHAFSSTDEHDAGVLTSGYTTKNPGAKLNDFFRYDGPYSVSLKNNEIVVDEAAVYSISIAETQNGTVDTDFTQAAENQTVTLTVTPAKSYALKADSFKVRYNDGVNIDDQVIIPTQDQEDSTKYTFVMPAYAVTVAAEFGKAAAQIGETPYPSLADAMAAVKPGETIRLLTDCSGVGFYIDKPLTIDFNGCTYTVLPPAIGGSEYTQNQAFHIQYPTDAGYTGGVTFKNGTIAIDASNAECTDKPITRVIQNYVDLTLDTMTITDDNMRLRKDGQHNPAEDTGEVGFAKDTLVECDGGSSVFKNCTITAKTESRFAIAVDDWQAMCETGTQLTIVGGTVTGKLRFYSEGEPETLKSTLTFEDYTTEVFSDTITDDAGAVEQEKVVFDEKEGGGHKLVKSDAGETEEESYMIVGKDIFFRVGENYYKTFAEALAAAQSGDTVELLDDCDLKDENPELPENVTLDLGGRTLSCGILDAQTKDGRIIDSSDGKGKLKGTLLLTETDGSYCPIYDTDGYRFFCGAIQRTTPEVSGEKLLFCFRFTFTNPDAYALLAAKGENVKLDFDVVSADGKDCYRMNSATTAEYLEKAATDEYMICVELDGYNEKHDVRTEFRLNITGECTWKAGEAKETYNPSAN